MKGSDECGRPGWGNPGFIRDELPGPLQKECLLYRFHNQASQTSHCVQGGAFCCHPRLDIHLEDWIAMVDGCKIDHLNTVQYVFFGRAHLWV